MDLFSALADPNRRLIIELLAQNGPLAASDIYGRFEVSAPAISQHLQILKSADLVIMEKKAQQRLYQINPTKVNELEQWVDSLRAGWNESFDRLDQFLAVEK